MRQAYLFIAFCFLSSSALIAQVFEHEIHGVDSAAVELVEEIIDREVTFKDSSSFVNYLEKLVTDQQLDGYWAAAVDSLLVSQSFAKAWIFIGKKYSIGQINVRENEAELFEGNGLRFKSKKNRQQSDLRKSLSDILKYSENNGYPFASAKLDSISWNENSLTATLNYQPGPLIAMSDISIEGDVNISQNYLSHYLGLRKGKPYSEKKILAVKRRLSELPFLEETADPVVTFEDKEAVLNLFLKKKKAGRFDFVLGLLPQTNSTGDPGSPNRLLLSGTLDAAFQNALGNGEQFSFKYEQLPPSTQELQLAFNYPYLFGLPVGGDVNFELYRRDSSYIDIIIELGVQYLFQGGNYLKVFWREANTNLLTVDEQRILGNRALPDILDVRNNTFGLEYNWQQLDYRFNPRKGWRINVKGAAGLKRISESSLITQLDDTEDGFVFSTLYDSLMQRSSQYRLQLSAAYFLPVMQRSTIMLGINGGTILAGQTVYRNEQYRIGGNRLLRGFNEESLFATQFMVSSIEFRQLISKNSYLVTFADLGYIENSTVAGTFFDQPLGFGAGISFETAAGIFGINMAWGRRMDIPIDWAAPRLHFGYLNLF